MIFDFHFFPDLLNPQSGPAAFVIPDSYQTIPEVDFHVAAASNENLLTWKYRKSKFDFSFSLNSFGLIKVIFGSDALGRNALGRLTVNK